MDSIFKITKISSCGVTITGLEKDNSEYSFDKVKFNYSTKNDIDLNDSHYLNEDNFSYNNKSIPIPVDVYNKIEIVEDFEKGNPIETDDFLLCEKGLLQNVEKFVESVCYRSGQMDVEKNICNCGIKIHDLIKTEI